MLYTPRKLGTIDFAETQRKTLSIDRDGVAMQFNLELEFTITNSATPAVAPKWEALGALIKRLEIIMGGRDTVVSIDGPGLIARARYEFGQAPLGVDDTVVLAGSAATTYKVVIPVIFWSPRGRRPDDTALDLRRVRQATLAITWGDIDDFYGTPNAATISAVTCTVEAHYMLDVPADSVYLVRQLSTIEEEVTASNSGLTILVDGITGLMLRSVMVVGTVDDVANDTILDDGSLRLESGSFVFANQDGPMLQGDNVLQFATAKQTGVYFQNMLKFGEAAHLINTANLTANLNGIFDVTKQAGTNKLKLYLESWRPLKVATVG